MSSNRFLIIDYETRSFSDLPSVGAPEYAAHPTTEILCASFQIGELKDLSPIKTYSPFLPETKSIGLELLSYFLDETITIVAHNAGFERVITNHVFRKLAPKVFKELKPNRFLCTAAIARSLSLPADLQRCAAVLGLESQKDMEGSRAMMRLSIPKDGKFNQDMALLKRVIQYCETDLKTQTELFLKLPRLLPSEYELWVLNEKINGRGFLVDRELIKSALFMIGEQEKNLRQNIMRLTGNAIDTTTKRDQLITFLNSRYKLNLIDLTKKTVEMVLEKKDLNENARKILELRQVGAKASIKKYQAFFNRSQFDGRCRENMIYHGASTGRFSGTGIQIQNLARPTVKVDQVLIDKIKSKSLLENEVSPVLSSALRSCIIATPGFELFCGDYAGIEARQVFWVANHNEGLKAFLENRDLYKELAASIFKKPAGEIADHERFLGKQATLGCGYEMGASKFKQTCAGYGVEISDELAKMAVDTYRRVNKPVADIWGQLERAFLSAIKNPLKPFFAGKCVFKKVDDFLFVTLPSGRSLSYFKPKIKVESGRFGMQEKIYYMGIDSLTKQWVEQSTYGGRICENLVQGISRDIMTTALKKLDKKGYKILITVHDEILAEKEKGKGSLKEFLEIMSECPAWAQGSAIKVEGWTGERYRK